MQLSKEFYHHLGKMLSARRRARRMTQLELAGLCQTSAQFISNIERGVCGPPYDLLRRMMGVLKIKNSAILRLVAQDINRNLIYLKNVAGS